MSKVERKEYHETKILKTRSPVRGTRGSSQNLAEFDNNLDYLLEDLQSSVARPTTNTLGSNTYRETRVRQSNADSGRSNSLNRVTHLKASNPVTEYSSDDSYNYTSPDGSKSVKSFKKESYSYSSSGDKVAPEQLRMQNNINQLDSLLDDLKQVKQGSSINNSGIDPGLVETSKSRVMMGKKVVERELHYGDTPPRSGSRTTERSEREGSVTRDIQYIDEGTYGETRPIRYRTPSPSQSQTSTLTKQKKVTNVHAYPMEVMETSTPDINPEILANLDPNLLPAGNTKVTTTIKTYTYEIPGSGYKPAAISPDSEKYIYSPNQSQTTPSKSFVYSKVENNDVTNTVTYIPPPSEQSWKANVYKETVTSNQSAPPYQRPPPPTGSDSTVVKETTTTRNYQPGYHPYPDPPSKQAYLYNETRTTTTKNLTDGYPDGSLGRPVNREPPINETYIYNKETHNTSTNKKAGPYPNGYPPHEPGSTTVIYKHDTHTTNYDAPPPRRQTPPNTTVIINKTETNTSENYDPNRYPYSGRPNDSPHSRRPNEPPHDPNNVNITYKYTSQTSNNYKGYPPGEESQPLLRPQPFPSDGEIDGPPKRVEQLMASIGNEPPDSPLNSGFTAHEAELIHQKKVDTLKHQQESNDLQKKEKNAPPTKNITGPAVYYPPGHEMFAQKEESGAWRAEGAMAKESGKYKYEAESSSKSKSRSGAAIVPVCLPLCCGIPCTIL